MKLKLLLGSFFLFAFVTANAYEVNGDLEVKWTGYKTEKKVPVSGTFNEIKLDISKNENFEDFLKSAKVKINTLTFDSGLEVRNKSIITTLFSLKSSEEIRGVIKNVNTSSKTLILNLTMNEVKKDVFLSYEVKNGMLIAKGLIDILDYSLDESFAKFAKECFILHQGKSYSEVNIEFVLPFKN